MRPSKELFSAALGCVALSSFSSAMATPGQLNLVFGNEGTLSSDIGCNLQVLVPMRVLLARDAQGSLYQVAYCAVTLPDDTAGNSIKVIKLDANGNRVTDFGTAGIVTFNTSVYDTANAVTIDSNDNLYIAGQSLLFPNSQPTPAFAVWKLDGGSGSLVASFGTAGVQTIPIDQQSQANAILLDGGNLYLAGNSTPLQDSGYAVVKLDTNGNVVTSFGNAGTATFPAGSDTSGAAVAMAMDSSGDLYLAGISTSDDTGEADFAVVKVNGASGNLVGGFGTGGMETFSPISNSDSLANAIAVDSAGGVYVGGASYPDEAAGTAVVAKVSATSGNLVAGFGTDGIRTINITGDGSAATTLAVDGDGNVYVAGTQNGPGTFSMLVSKLNPTSGAFVAGFGTDGSSLVTITGTDETDSMVLDSIGHLYLAGQSTNYDAESGVSDRVLLAASLLTANNVSKTTLTSSLNPAAAGMIVTFSASVSGSGATPSGEVTFSDGSTVICANVALASGRAACTTSTLAGSTTAHAISANYTGDANNLGSISSVVEQLILGNEIFKGSFE